MFMGEFYHTVDAKGRMIVPADYREELGEKCVITLGLDECLNIYTQEEWKDTVGKLNNLSRSNPRSRQLMRHFLGNSKELEFDKQGRILIPSNLRTKAHIDKDVIVIGLNTQIEIWSKDVYCKVYEAVDESISDIAASLDFEL